MAKKTSSSRAAMEAIFGHALVQPKATTSSEVKAETKAAQSLGVEVLGSASTSPGLRTWRAQGKDGKPVALVTLAETVTPQERERVALNLVALHAAGAAQLAGVLPVYQMTDEHDAFVTDLWTTGTAKDLSALRWPFRKRLDFVAAVTRAVAKLHAAGLAHGCLCPDNILLDDDLRPVLSEAGLVDVRALIARRDVLVYEAFAAPELKAGAEPTPAADLYSLGRLLLALTGGDEKVPPSVTAIAQRCLAQPLARYASADELVAALEAAAGALPLVEEVRAPEPRKAPPAAMGGAAERKERPAAAPERPDRATPSPQGASWEMPEPPAWLGIAGIVMVVGALVTGALVGSGSESVRTLLAIALPLGSALATTLAPPLPRGRVAARLALAIGLAALAAVWSPLPFAYRVAAQAHLKGSDEMKRKAVAEILLLGGDFRGFSLVGVNLEHVDLTGANLRGVDMTGADMRGAKLVAANLEDAKLDGTALAGADLTFTDLQLATFNFALCDEMTVFPPGFVCESGHIGRRASAPAP
jgi:hypothetical protein